jgi:hypothetical protein
MGCTQSKTRGHASPVRESELRSDGMGHFWNKENEEAGARGDASL